MLGKAHSRTDREGNLRSGSPVLQVSGTLPFLGMLAMLCQQGWGRRVFRRVGLEGGSYPGTFGMAQVGPTEFPEYSLERLDKG